MKYAQEDAVEKATILFWKKGFQGSGMRDIQQALDMRPGSIYARFQNKEGLFKLVVEQYVAHSKDKLQNVAESDTPLLSLREFFKTALINPDELRYMRQCLLVKSITELELIGDLGKKAVLEGMVLLNNSFANIIEKAIETKELQDTTPVAFAADWLQNQFVGLRAFAILQTDNSAIEKMIDKVLYDLAAQWPSN
ncbi:TetR/AcrR family transcriptional regulator [Alteromonas sp.]|jgi:AcrR family transcriptional regulator|uniref:TetR/AcrR family transcriptional regulator n=1 Tax=Alteromonas sp. TaxID=232 RepID=UPI000B6D9234|nr:TetR/AcrR family transcriptional regulator [Alteromonas sp.]MAI36005.1 TetR family transcriptional regulator [Alteromonas sp.]OUX92370.1 MAG: TetR family transcriptional regulator [Alteromonas sp. TMED35]|tara:strand:- start:1843 stop:2427 length:585 start_codon:yes stop_codon:yes gene_type:complete